MGVFRYADKYAALTKEQREQYMTGKSEEHHFDLVAKKIVKQQKRTSCPGARLRLTIFCSNPVDTRVPGLTLSLFSILVCGYREKKHLSAFIFAFCWI